MEPIKLAAGELSPPAPASNRHRCVFRIDCPDVDQICLVGSFNNWSTTANPMKHKKNGQWEVEMMLKPGMYNYSYFVIGMVQPEGTGQKMMRSFMICKGYTLQVGNGASDGIRRQPLN